MKIRFLLLIIFLLGFVKFSQCQEYAVDKGATFISGVGSFSSSGGELFEDSDSNRRTSFTLTPSINHFIGKNFFIGGAIELSNESQGDVSAKSIGIGPQLGYAFGNSGSTTFPYLSTGLKYYDMNMEDGDSYSSDINISGTDITIGFGVIIPLRRHVGFVFEGGYHMMNLKNKDNDTSSSGNIFSIGVGIAGLFF